MNYWKLLCILCIFCLPACQGGDQAKDEGKPGSQDTLSQTGMDELITKILSSPPKKPGFAYRFIQTTIRFDSTGTPSDTSLWYEAIQMPDKFRIDFGPLEAGNTVMFRSDSAYRYRDSQLDTSYYAPQDFLFFEGGFPGCEDVAAVKARLKVLEIDPEKFHLNEEKGVYVFGAEAGDTTSKQMWLDQEHLYIVKGVLPRGEDNVIVLDFQEFKQFGDDWIESVVLIYRNGQLIQEEYYKDIVADITLPDGFFDPNRAFEAHWYSGE